TTTGATGGSATSSGGAGTSGGGSGGSGATTTGSGGTGATTATGSGGEGNTPLCPDENGKPIPKLKPTQVATGLAPPLLAIRPTGDASRLYILEGVGRVRVMKNGVLQPDPFLDLTDLVISSGERGLLGLAFHPDYQNNGRFWVNYNQLSDNH